MTVSARRGSSTVIPFRLCCRALRMTTRSGDAGITSKDNIPLPSFRLSVAVVASPPNAPRPNPAPAAPRPRAVRADLASRGRGAAAVRQQPPGVRCRAARPPLALAAPRAGARLYGLVRRGHAAVGRGAPRPPRSALAGHGARGGDERLGRLPHPVPNGGRPHDDVDDAARRRAAARSDDLDLHDVRRYRGVLRDCRSAGDLLWRGPLAPGSHA